MLLLAVSHSSCFVQQCMLAGQPTLVAVNLAGVMCAAENAAVRVCWLALLHTKWLCCCHQSTWPGCFCFTVEQSMRIGKHVYRLLLCACMHSSTQQSAMECTVANCHSDHSVGQAHCIGHSIGTLIYVGHVCIGHMSVFLILPRCCDRSCNRYYLTDVSTGDRC
jgi:hypothetical protein